MSDAGFVTGLLLATLLPAAIMGRLVQRRVRGPVGGLLAAAAALGAAWLGLGAFVSVALSDLSVAMD